ncbi:putative J domain-containing protein [Seiridium cardinale]
MPRKYATLPAGLRLALQPQSQWATPPLLLACPGWQHQQKQQQQRRQPFHTTSPLRDDKAEIDSATNHYETLKLAPGATTAEIKKSFYSLSKSHHPDHNRSDPKSASRFMRISEAYSTLSQPEKRSKYDRDVLGLGRTTVPRGSYSSTNPAGGRPASGLSRRRSAFRGPPPSFYRSGGWGTHGSKRSAAHDESTGGAASGGGTTKDHHNDGAWANSSHTTGTGGMGPGQDPFGHRHDVPHFDREGHERTQRHTEEHRTRSWRMRMGGGYDRAEVEAEKGATGMFFVIGGVIMLSFLGPLIFSRAWMDNKGKKRKKSVAKT